MVLNSVLNIKKSVQSVPVSISESESKTYYDQKNFVKQGFGPILLLDFYIIKYLNPMFHEIQIKKKTVKIIFCPIEICVHYVCFQVKIYNFIPQFIILAPV